MAVSQQPRLSGSLLLPECTLDKDEERPDEPLQESPESECSRSGYTSASTADTTDDSTIRTSLPPTPVAKSPRHLHSPVSASSAGLLSPASRSKSPSIAKLDSLSVVTQRLAQIERNDSARSTTTLRTTTTAVTTLMRAQMTQPPEVGRAFGEIEKMHERKTLITGMSTDASVVIPLPALPKSPDTPGSETGSALSRSAFNRRWLSPLAEASSVTLPAALSEPVVRELAENPPTLPLSVEVEPRLAPVVELIKDSAAKHYDQTAGLGEQVIALQRDIHNLPEQLRFLIEGAVTTVTRANTGSDKFDHSDVSILAANLQEIREVCRNSTQSQQIMTMASIVGELQSAIEKHMPQILDRLASVERGQLRISSGRKDGVNEASMKNLGSSTSARIPSSSGEQTSVGSQWTTDLSNIHAKLDNLLSLYDASTSRTAEMTSTGKAVPGTESENCQMVLEKVITPLSLLRTH